MTTIPFHIYDGDHRDCIVAAATALGLTVNEQPGSGGLDFVVTVPNAETAYRFGLLAGRNLMASAIAHTHTTSDPIS